MPLTRSSIVAETRSWIGTPYRHQASLKGVSCLLMAYFGARFGVLGIYVNGRSREKQACVTGQAQPSVVEQVVKALVKKK